MKDVKSEKAKKIQEELSQLIKEKSSEVLYLAIYETCVKFGLFMNPESMYLVIFTALKTFITDILSRIKDEDENKKQRDIIKRLSHKLYLEFKAD